MGESEDRDTALDSAVRQVLRDLPPRRAPATLETRVTRELRRRAAARWQSIFEQWSWFMRTAFASACILVMALSVGLGVWAARFAPPVMQPAFAVMAAAHELSLLLARLIPTPWIQLGLGVGALLYVTLFGLGAAGYRALYLQPGNGR